MIGDLSHTFSLVSPVSPGTAWVNVMNIFRYDTPFPDTDLIAGPVKAVDILALSTVLFLSILCLGLLETKHNSSLERQKG